MGSFVKTLFALFLSSVVLFQFSSAAVMAEEESMWEQTMANADWIKRGIRGNVNELLYNQYQAANVSQSCKEGMDLYSKALDEWKPWAMQMADATSKLSAGILAGTMVDFGAFEECLAVRSEALQGRFCMAGFSSPILNSTRYGVEAYVRKFGQPPEWIQHYLANKSALGENGTLWLGICLPSTCSEMDIHSILSTGLVSMKYHVKLSDCQVDEPKNISFNSIVALYGILGIFTLCVVGTLLDVYYKPKSLEPSADNSLEDEGMVVAILKTFSVRLNLYRLNMMSNHVTFLDFSHGYRVIGCCVEVLAHIILYPNRWILDQRSGMMRSEDFLIGYGIERAFMENGSILIEGFFVLSGFLLVFTMWGKLEKSGGYVNVPLFILKRCCRIFPSLLFVIALYFVVPLLNRGPIWNSTWEEQVQNCENNMWKNFLFIDNFWNWKEGHCLLHTWFIASLMQVQIPGLLLLLFTFRWRIGGIIVGCLGVAGTTFLVFLKSMNSRDEPPTFTQNDADHTTSHYEEFYFKSLSHYGPYAVGMVAGYIVLKYKDRVPSKRWQVVGWLLTLVTWWWSWNGMALVPVPGGGVHFALYLALNRLFWSVGFAWMMYACAVGIAETLRKCLSWRPLVYFSNLHFSMYLVHPLLIFYKYGAAKERTGFQYVYFVYDTVAVFAMGYAVSFFVHLAVESPFSILEWKLLGSETAVKRKTTSEDKKTT